MAEVEPLLSADERKSVNLSSSPIDTIEKEEGKFSMYLIILIFLLL